MTKEEKEINVWNKQKT